jgi:hypothetical protein
MQFKRVIAFLALVLGFLGVVACVAGIYVAWSLGSRIEQANEKVFATLDKGLDAAQDRLRGVQKRVGESKVTAMEIQQYLRDWSKRRAGERLVSHLEIDSRADKLAGRLQTADVWLETSTESIRGIQQVMELGNSLGADMEPASVEEIVAKLASLRSALQQTQRTVEEIREATAARESDSEDTRVSRVTKLVGRTLLALSDIDTRLENSVARLSDMRANARESKARMSNYILLTTIGCSLLLAWVALGQAALCLCGWRQARKRTS